MMDSGLVPLGYWDSWATEAMEVDEAMTSAPMETDLTDDAWQHVFRQLPVKERVRLERVCRRWWRLMPYADVRSVEVGRLGWKAEQRTTFKYEDGQLLNSQPSLKAYWLRQALGSLLERAGPFLASLSFASAQLRFCLANDTLQLIADEAPQLRRLDLSTTLLRQSALSLLKAFPLLEYVSLGSAVFLDEGAKLVSDHGALKAELEALVEGAAHLRHLNLYQIPFAPRLRNPHLQRLQLSRLPIDDIALQQIVRECPTLVSLGISHCRAIQSFAPLASLGGSLRRLFVSFTSIGDLDFAAVAAACGGLEELRVDGAWRLESFAPLQSLSRLRVFSVSDSAAFTDRALARIARFGRLRVLSAAGCPITDEGARYVSQLCRGSLERLNLANTRVTGRGALWVAESAALLRELNVQSTGFGDEALGVLAASAPRLAALYVQHCPDLGDTGFQALLQARLRAMKRGGPESLAELLVLAKSEGGDSPVSDSTIRRLRCARVDLVVQRPMLALPGPTE